MYQLIRLHINTYPKVIGSNLSREDAEKYAEKLNKKCNWTELNIVIPMVESNFINKINNINEYLEVKE